MTDPIIAARAICVVQRIGGTPQDVMEILGITQAAMEDLCVTHGATMRDVWRRMGLAAKAAASAKAASRKTPTKPARRRSSGEKRK